MARSFLLLVMMLCFLLSNSQNISVTFTGKGAAVKIDSVKATNLRTSLSVTLPGDKTLVLSLNSGIPPFAGSWSECIVFPNPFPGKARFSANVQTHQTVYLVVRNLVGEVMAQTKVPVQPGENDFSLSLNTAGIFVISLVTDQGTSSYKVICTGAHTPENSIQFLGSGSGNHNYQNLLTNPSPSGLKSSQTGYVLGYASGDIILYRCSSGICSTILTDAPASSKNYEVEFVACTDPAEKNYSIVKIGDQTWMAENLAWLPAVSPASSGSDFSPYYYVYDYDGSAVSEAKAGAGYPIYGALYNWEAARIACPSGWHLPDEPEWTVLNNFLGASAGGKLKETGTEHWLGPNTTATNERGFTALPGGLRSYPGGFADRGNYGYFWTAAEGDATHAWVRILVAYDDGMGKYPVSRNRGYSVRCLRSPVAVLASVTTQRISAITNISASGGGNVTSDGGAVVMARGVCRSTQPNPTVADMHTADGSGTGEFTSELTGLAPNTEYHVRAYAVNSAGTAYGNEVSFKTPAGFTCGSSLIVNHKAGAVAPVDKTVSYGTVKNIPGDPAKCWLTSNLGAGRQAILVDDASEASAGWYWQFNRIQGFSHDGATRAPNSTWISEINQDLDWQASNDPCAAELGEGWRIPTLTEWTRVDGVSGGNWNNWYHPWYSELKLHAAGLLRYNDGSLNYRGEHGVYWSSTRYSALSGWALDFSNDYSGMYGGNKAYAYPIRCLLECAAPPSNPGSGSHKPSQTQIIWTWKPVPEATGYKANTTNDYESASDLGADTSYTETGLTCGTSYTRYLWAYNSCGHSNPLSVAQSTLGCTNCGSSVTVNHQAGTVAPVNKTVTYGTVTNIPGEPSKCWLTSNLGADRQATAVDDASEASAGWYWQFNRKQGYKHDGTARTPNSAWISNIDENPGWVAANDPCRTELGGDWRLPTSTEWANADGVDGGNWINKFGPWNSRLKLHAAGCLFPSDGSLNFRGSYGYYWSSAQVSPSVGWSLAFDGGGSSKYDMGKATGLPIRCIK